MVDAYLKIYPAKKGSASGSVVGVLENTVFDEGLDVVREFFAHDAEVTFDDVASTVNQVLRRVPQEKVRRLRSCFLRP